MKLEWTAKALSDVECLHEFLADVNPKAAAQIVQSLVKAPLRLLDHPRLGKKLENFGTREIRRIFVEHYEIRYEIQEDFIYLLRFFHTREERCLS